jgi:hypothetical protein
MMIFSLRSSVAFEFEASYYVFCEWVLVMQSLSTVAGGSERK